MGINHLIGTEPSTIIPSLHINEYEVYKWYSKDVVPLEEVTCRQNHKWYIEI